MTRHELTAVVKLMFGPKMIATTSDLIEAHQKKANADGDLDLVTELGNARKEIAKLMKPKVEEPVAPPAETATLSPSTEPEPEGGRRRSRS